MTAHARKRRVKVLTEDEMLQQYDAAIERGSIKSDPVVRDVERYWGHRETILRTIRRWDGPLTAYELFDALGINHGTTESNAAQKALSRLVEEGLVMQEPVRVFSHLQIYFSGRQGAKYEYTAVQS